MLKESFYPYYLNLSNCPKRQHKKVAPDLSCVRNAFEAFPLIPYLVVNKIKGDQNTQKVTWTLKEAKQLTANDHECVSKLILVKHLLS